MTVRCASIHDAGSRSISPRTGRTNSMISGGVYHSSSAVAPRLSHPDTNVAACCKVKSATVAILARTFALPVAKVRAKMATVADLTLQQAATLVSGCERRGANADDEWYTPPEIIELVRTVLGEIDLDPASCIEAQRTVMAKRFYTKHNDGL